MSKIFFKNYYRTGEGISKERSRKKGIKLYFEILGVRIWKLFALNLIFTLFCIPVVTIGPALAGMTKVLRNYVIDKNSFVFHDFFEAFKKNFKKAFVVGIVDIIAYTGIFLGCWMYPEFAKVEGYGYFNVLFMITVAVGLAFTIMNYYMYLMMVSTDLSMKNIVKNSLALSFISPKQNFLAAFIMIAVFSIIGFILRINYEILLVLPFFPAAIVAFTVCFLCYPVVQKYVINPYYEARGEINPELPEYVPEDSEEVLFEDMGGKEQPTQTDESGKEKKGSRKHTVKKKGKTIS